MKSFVKTLNNKDMMVSADYESDEDFETQQKRKEEPKQKKDDEPPVVDGIPVNTANDPADATANKTALEVHEGIVAAMTEV